MFACQFFRKIIDLQLYIGDHNSALVWSSNGYPGQEIKNQPILFTYLYSTCARSI